MRPTLLLAIPAALLLVAVGCAEPVVEAPSQPFAARTATRAAASAAVAVDAAYLAALAGHGVGTGDAERELRRAHALCDLLRSGTSFKNTIQALLSNGFTTSDAGYVIGAAVAAYCPDQRGKVA